MTFRRMGIDPGQRNLGFAIIGEDDSILESGVMDVKKLGITNVVRELRSTANIAGVKSLGLERYVAYAGVHNAASEDILMVTGALLYGMENEGISVHMARAIDWKPYVCKDLFRKRDFSNPSGAKKFDKDFSMAAAECIIRNPIETDHEADAVCLAYFGGLMYEKAQ